MIQRYGRKGTEFEGIFFTEGPIVGGAKLGDLKVESRKQNTNLDELKQQLAVFLCHNFVLLHDYPQLICAIHGMALASLCQKESK